MLDFHLYGLELTVLELLEQCLVLRVYDFLDDAWLGLVVRVLVLTVLDVAVVLVLVEGF